MEPLPLVCIPWLLLIQMPVWCTSTRFMEDVSMWLVMLAVPRWSLVECGPSAIMLRWWVLDFHVRRFPKWVIEKERQPFVLCPFLNSVELYSVSVFMVWCLYALTLHAEIRSSHNTLIGWWTCLDLWRRTSTLSSLLVVRCNSWCRNKHRLTGSFWSSPTIRLNKFRSYRPRCRLSIHNFTAKVKLRTSASRCLRFGFLIYVACCGSARDMMVNVGVGMSCFALTVVWWWWWGLVVPCAWLLLWCPSTMFWGSCQPPFQPGLATVSSLGCLRCWSFSKFAGLERPLFQVRLVRPCGRLDHSVTTVNALSSQPKTVRYTKRQSGGLEHVFFHLLGIIIPTDFHIFQRGR